MAHIDFAEASPVQLGNLYNNATWFMFSSENNLIPDLWIAIGWMTIALVYYSQCNYHYRVAANYRLYLIYHDLELADHAVDALIASTLLWGKAVEHDPNNVSFQRKRDEIAAKAC